MVPLRWMVAARRATGARCRGTARRGTNAEDPPHIKKTARRALTSNAWTRGARAGDTPSHASGPPPLSRVRRRRRGSGARSATPARLTAALLAVADAVCPPPVVHGASRAICPPRGAACPRRPPHGLDADANGVGAATASLLRRCSALRARRAYDRNAGVGGRRGCLGRGGSHDVARRQRGRAPEVGGGGGTGRWWRSAAVDPAA